MAVSRTIHSCEIEIPHIELVKHVRMTAAPFIEKALGMQTGEVRLDEIGVAFGAEPGEQGPGIGRVKALATYRRGPL